MSAAGLHQQIRDARAASCGSCSASTLMHLAVRIVDDPLRQLFVIACRSRARTRD